MMRLFIVECRRNLTRGVTRILVAVAAIGIVVLGVGTFVTTNSEAQIREQVIANAQRERDQTPKMSEADIQVCIDQMTARATSSTAQVPGTPGSVIDGDQGSTTPGSAAVDTTSSTRAGGRTPPTSYDRFAPIMNGTATPELIRDYCDGEPPGYRNYSYGYGVPTVFAFTSMWIVPVDDQGDDQGDDRTGSVSGGSGRTTATVSGVIGPSSDTGDPSATFDPATAPLRTNADRGDSKSSYLFVVAPLLALGALIGAASLIGSEWQTGSMIVFLTWEPRRVRVALAKIGSTALLAALIAFMLQVLFAAAFFPTAALKGTTAGVDGAWWVALLEAMARISLVAALAAIIGSSLAMIGRRTALAIAGSFLYLAIVEPILSAWQPAWQAWTVGINSGVVLTGTTLTHKAYDTRTGVAEVLWTREPGAAVLILVFWAAVFVLLAVLAFRRRDFASG